VGLQGSVGRLENTTSSWVQLLKDQESSPLLKDWERSLKKKMIICIEILLEIYFIVQI
jgi:hypothetical protein